MHVQDVKKLFAALGVEIDIHRNDYGAWEGYHYRWDPFNEGWECSKVTDVSETYEQALGKVVMIASGLIVAKKRLLHDVREAGYGVNGFVYPQKSYLF